YQGQAIQGYFGPDIKVSVRRNIFTDSYNLDTIGHSAGLFALNIANLLVEENVFDHNGWNASIAGAEPTIFNHDLYIHDLNGPATVRGNIFANASSHGAQVRPGGNITNNLFVRNPIGLMIGSAEAVLSNSATATDNVFMEGNDIDPLTPRGF